MPKNDIHPAMFLEEFAERVIRLYTDYGDIVLDPFAGSGATTLVAVRLGRRWIAILKEASYVQLAAKRIGSLTSNFVTHVDEVKE